MTAAESRSLLQGLEREGWRCFASVSDPIQADRCFGSLPDRTDRTMDGVARIVLVHLLPRSKGGGPLTSLTLDVVGPEAVTERGRRAVHLIGDILLDGQGALLAPDMQGPGSLGGAYVRFPVEGELYLADLKLRTTADYLPTTFASTTAVRRALAAARSTVSCAATAPSSTGFSCTGAAPGVAAGVAATQVDVHTDPRGSTAAHWFVSVAPTQPAGRGGPTPADAARYVDAAASVAATAGIITAPQEAWLHAHAHDPEVEADVGGHHLVVDYDERGDLELTVEAIDLT